MNKILPAVRICAIIASVIVFLLNIASAFGGHISPSFSSIPSILTLALPYFTLLTLITAVAWAIVRNWPMTIAGAATILICISPILNIFPLGHKYKPSPSDHPVFTLMTHNILHGDDIEETDSTINRSFEFILDRNPDIVILQELYNFSKNEIKVLPKEMRDSIFARYPYRVTDGYNDLCLLSRYPARLYKIEGYPYGSSYFFECYRLNILGKKLTVVNVHLASYHLSEKERAVVDDSKSVKTVKSSLSTFKNSTLSKLKKSFVERDQHADEILKIIKDIRGPLILCGDFNDVPASWAYNKIRSAGLRDAYQETCFGYTSTYNLHHFYFHIDQILYRGDLKALDVQRGNVRSSDHYPLIATFAFTNP
ncbi:MAG: endonuclease/exonuclease/phosphatase family protein [Muribaculaceae bacterium]|nr:endonuclease/exonuclease/phosphatase family protein [Muribaculaceae bacterium]